MSQDITQKFINEIPTEIKKLVPVPTGLKVQFSEDQKDGFGSGWKTRWTTAAYLKLEDGNQADAWRYEQGDIPTAFDRIRNQIAEDFSDHQQSNCGVDGW